MPTPKKSIQDLKASGNYRPSRHGPEEDKPQLPISAPQAPHYVDKESLLYFEEIVGCGLDMDIVTKADATIIGLLSSEMSEWTQLNQAIRDEGFMVEMPTATGFMQTVVNPKIKIRDDKLKVILKMLGELGMSPAARSKVTVNQQNKDEKSALGEFLAEATKRMKGGPK
jgi:P27 family predicted phage terminase small subunit